MFDREIDNFLKDVLGQQRRTELGQLVEGYALCAQAEGKSPNYLSLVASSARSLERYLEANGLPKDVTEIDVQTIRGFVLHLQSTARSAFHRFIPAQPSGGFIWAYHQHVYVVAEGLLVLA